jgi:methylenetetrahydrofolate dehydrogenase (NADP+)/methenyltetrahydrofolate cyclohydrolase
MHLPAGISQSELLERVEQLNEDPKIHGILVQLPLPDPLDEAEVMLRVRPEKDVDGFHPVNVGRMVSGDPDAFRPATPARPVAEILSQKQPWANATVTLAHSRTHDMGEIGRLGDILIVAIGRADFVTSDMVKPGAVVIDVGVNRVDDPTREKGYRLVGDVDFDAVREVASWITPVPGGVGPMTIAMLLKNTIKAAGRFAA